jgi:hypothetical protein
MIVTKIQRRLVVMGRLRIKSTDRSIGHNRFFLFSYYCESRFNSTRRPSKLASRRFAFFFRIAPVSHPRILDFRYECIGVQADESLFARGGRLRFPGFIHELRAEANRR